MAPRTIDAVLLLLDDTLHSFYDVASALERLGLAPPVALMLTQETHDLGMSVVSKGSLFEMRQAADLLSPFNVSVVRTSHVDDAVAAAARSIASASRHMPSPRLHCVPWTLAGACTRQPLFMHSHCRVSCQALGAEYLSAAMARPPAPMLSMTFAQLSLLALALLSATVLTSEAVLFHRKLGAARRALAFRVVRALLAVHLFCDGVHTVAFAARAGFELDDGDGVMLQDALPPDDNAPPPAEAPAADSGSVLWQATATAALAATGLIGHAPWWLRAASGAAQCAAALLICAPPPPPKSESSYAMLHRGGGLVLLGSALCGALHVLLSAVAMAVMGAGVHLSELMAKRLALAGGMSLWLAHDAGTAAEARLQPTLPTTVPTHGVAEARHPWGALKTPSARPASHTLDGEGSGRGLLLLIGRLLVACLLAYVCGAECSRLLLAPLTYLGTDGAAAASVWSREKARAAAAAELLYAANASNATEMAIGSSAALRFVLQHHVANEHVEVVVRVPQLLLSVALALGVATGRAACALSLLSLAEAGLVWQWWKALDEPTRLARVGEHFTTNLAIAGCLMLLPLLGAGRYTLDRLVSKKRD